jgi:hypothetical protein
MARLGGRGQTLTPKPTTGTAVIRNLTVKH